jgi:hypothetical protein
MHYCVFFVILKSRKEFVRINQLFAFQTDNERLFIRLLYHAGFQHMEQQRPVVVPVDMAERRQAEYPLVEIFRAHFAGLRKDAQGLVEKERKRHFFHVRRFDPTVLNVQLDYGHGF